jgi:hypothetical protein
MPAETRESTTDVDVVRVIVLPGGRLDRNNAARYLNRKPQTMAAWAAQEKGPPVHHVGGRCFYFLADLDRFIEGDADRREEG